MISMRILIVPVLVLSGGCAPYTVPDIDFAHERYPGKPMPEERVYINKPYPGIDNVQFVVLRAHSNHSAKYAGFMKASLEKIGLKPVLSESAFAQLLISREVDADIRAAYDLVSLHRIYETIGEFLVIEAGLTHHGSYWFSTQVDVIDPKASEVKLRLNKHGANVMGIDRDFNYPAVNSLNVWYQASK